MYHAGGKLISRCRDVLIADHNKLLMWEGKRATISGICAQGTYHSRNLGDCPSSLPGKTHSMKTSERN